MTSPAAPTDPLSEAAAALDRIAREYASDVHWCAPRRGLELRGRVPLLRHLATEAAAMREPQLQVLRTASFGQRAVEESAVRFVYAGTGIAGLSLPAGSRVELVRVRLLERAQGKIRAETCIETWSVLPPADGSSSAPEWLPGSDPPAAPDPDDARTSLP